MNEQIKQSGVTAKLDYTEMQNTGNNNLVDPAASSPMTRRRILAGAGAIAAGACLPRYAFGASNPQPIPTGTIVNATMSVTATSQGTIPSLFNGFSFEKYYAGSGAVTGSNSALIGILQRQGAGVIRFGGASVDKQVWNESGPGGQANNSGTGVISYVDVQNVANFCSATGYKCIWGINFNGSTTTALATDEAAHVRDALGTTLLGIEIGNEPESYGITESAYGTKWKQFRDAIVARQPTMPFYAPVSAGVPWTTWFAQSSGYGHLITSLDTHYYRSTSGTPTATVDNLVNPQPDPNLAADLTQLQSDASGLGLPFRLAECNSISSGNPGINTTVGQSYASALWGLEYMFQVAKSGCAGVNFHCGDSRSAYTPFVLGEAGDLTQIRALYYGINMFQLLGLGTLYTTSFSGNKWTRAYAVKNSDLKIMVVNTDSSTNLYLTINVYTTVYGASLAAMTQLSSGASGANLSAIDGVMIRGAQVGVDNSYNPQPAYTLSYSGTQVTCYVPYLTACLIEVAV